MVTRLKHKVAARQAEKKPQVEEKTTFDRLVDEVTEDMSLKKVIKKVIHYVPDLNPVASTDPATRGRVVFPLSSTNLIFFFFTLSDLEKRIFAWHIANIEGLSGAQLSKLSYYHWDEEDSSEYYGGHCLIREGHSALLGMYIFFLQRKISYFSFVVGRKNGGRDGSQVESYCGAHRLQR